MLIRSRTLIAISFSLCTLYCMIYTRHSHAMRLMASQDQFCALITGLTGPRQVEDVDTEDYKHYLIYFTSATLSFTSINILYTTSFSTTSLHMLVYHFHDEAYSVINRTSI